MNTILSKAASVLAFAIGAMAIVAGGKVLLGQDPGYYVIDWVPIYNFSAGVITVLITAILLWKNSKYALPAAIATLSGHSIVMVILQIAYRAVVAPDSLRAMTIRIVVWIAILALLLIQAWKERPLVEKRNKGLPV
jgi:uncharacterized membrane protein